MNIFFSQQARDSGLKKKIPFMILTLIIFGVFSYYFKTVWPIAIAWPIGTLAIVGIIYYDKKNYEWGSYFTHTEFVYWCGAHPAEKKTISFDTVQSLIIKFDESDTVMFEMVAGKQQHIFLPALIGQGQYKTMNSQRHALVDWVKQVVQHYPNLKIRTVNSNWEDFDFYHAYCQDDGFIKRPENLKETVPPSLRSYVLLGLFLSVFAIIGTFLCGYSISATKASFIFMKDGIATSGQVVELKNVTDGMDDVTMYAPQVEYMTHDGLQRSFIPSSSESHPRYAAGDKISLLYLPDNPQKVTINDFWGLWLAPLLSGILGILFSLVGYGGLYVLHKDFKATLQKRTCS